MTKNQGEQHEGLSTKIIDLGVAVLLRFVLLLGTVAYWMFYDPKEAEMRD